MKSRGDAEPDGRRHGRPRRARASAACDRAPWREARRDGGRGHRPKRVMRDVPRARDARPMAMATPTNDLYGNAFLRGDAPDDKLPQAGMPATDALRLVA